MRDRLEEALAEARVVAIDREVFDEEGELGFVIEVGEELQLFVPVRYGDQRGWLIRRLADRSFILLHPPTPPTELTLDLVELAEIELGAPEQVRELPREGGDGCLRRSLIRLQDDSLGGLLGDTPLTSNRTWPEMDRAETSRVRR